MSIPEEWWRDFFEGPFGEIQVQEAGPQTTERDVERIVSRLGPAPRAVLDAPCGAGRHSLELAARGYDVLGIDFNPTVLTAARSAARARKLEAEFQLQDLRELNAEEQYDAVICLWTSIGYFSEEDNERVLLNLARAVKPGGHLFLDLVVLESLCAKFSPRDWAWWGSGESRLRVCEERTWDPARSRVNVTWTFIRDQREEIRESSIRVYSCHELSRILERGGMSELSYLGKEGEPFQIGSHRLWLEARKPL